MSHERIALLLEDRQTFRRAGRDLRMMRERLDGGAQLTRHELARLDALEKDKGRPSPPGTRPVHSKPITRQPDPPAWMLDPGLLPKRPPAIP